MGLGVGSVGWDFLFFFAGYRNIFFIIHACLDVTQISFWQTFNKQYALYVV